MDGRDRAPVATFHAEGAIAPGARLLLGEGAAHHARVRRLEQGEVVAVTNGQGSVGTGVIARLSKGTLELDVLHGETVPPPPPLHLLVPVADRDRMLWLAEKVTELAVTSWQPVLFRRSQSVSPRGSGPGFQEKVLARMVSALEQSRGAWLPERRPEIPLAAAAEQTEAATRLVFDVDGEPVVSCARGTVAPAVLIGPEGGIEPDEMALLRTHGWRLASLGATTLRFETAGIAAAAVLRAMLVAEPTRFAASTDTRES